MSTLKVNKIENTSTTDGGISIDNTGGVQVNGVQLPTAGPLSNRNLIINGAMRVAQRGTSSTDNGHTTVDRFRVEASGGTVTHSQEALTTGAGDADVYNLGFRYFLRQTNDSTASGANNYRFIKYQPEGQDVATSGWNYTSSTSNITLSFWVRSSVSQEFYGYILTEGATARVYTFSTGTLAANTWTKVTKTIPGDSNVGIPNDTTSGLQIVLASFWGTNFTNAGATLDTWRNYVPSYWRTPVYTTSWVSTIGATFDLTGVQLEVGSKATPFEHRSYADELHKCHRYYYKVADGSVSVSAPLANPTYYNTTTIYGAFHMPVVMRGTPSIDQTTGTDYYISYSNNTNQKGNSISIWTNSYATCVEFVCGLNAAGTAGQSSIFRLNNSSAYVALAAEL